MHGPRLLFASLTAAVSLAWPAASRADDAADCASGAGTLLTGVVVSKPRFVGGKPLRGIPLTHTHIRIRGDADGKTYDLAVDDVFASGYDPRRPEVPAPLDGIAVGQHLQACGVPYPGGMHWVHTNCGDTPTAQDPNGWLKVIGATGAAGPNLEDSQKYFYLWPKNGSTHHKKHRATPPQSV